MTYDAKVTITNYIATDTYEINIYKENSVVPVLTLAVDRNAGPIHYLRNLPAGFNYSAEVVHYCADDPGNPSRYKKLIEVAGGTPTCNCPPGYTAVGNACIKFVTRPANPVLQEPVPSFVITGDVGFNINGIRVYDVGDPSVATVAYDSDLTVNYWKAVDAATGRMNIAGIQGDYGSVAPVAFRVPAKVTVVGAGRLMYVAFSADHGAFEVWHNGLILIKRDDTENLKARLQCYPVFLREGDNFFEFINLTEDGTCKMVVEIYDCGLPVLKDVDTGLEVSLNRQFSTADYQAAEGTFYNHYACFPKYMLDVSGPGVQCVMAQFASCL